MSIQEKKYTRKKNGKETIKYYANVWDSKNKRAVTGTLRSNRKDAVKDEASLLKQLEDGLNLTTKSKKFLFGTAATMWQEATKGHYASQTYKVYKQYYKNYIADGFADVPVVQIKSQHLQKYVNIMKTTYSAETVNKCINILSDIFNFCIQTLDIIHDNPCKGIIRCKSIIKVRPTWSDEQCSYFLDLPIVKNSPYYSMLAVSILCGCRPGEVCGLLESDLNDNMDLSLSNGLDRDGDLTSMKNSNSHRGLPLPENLYALLVKSLHWKKKKQMEMNQYGIMFADNNFLFVNKYGKPVTPSVYSKAFKRLLRQHNNEMQELLDEKGYIPPTAQMLPDISLYDCRHSFATNNIRNKEGFKVVSTIMGNSVKTLLSRYAHVDTDMKRDVLKNYSSKIAN